MVDYYRVFEIVTENCNIICNSVQKKIKKVDFIHVVGDAQHDLKNSNLVVYFIYEKLIVEKVFIFKILQDL